MKHLKFMYSASAQIIPFGMEAIAAVLAWLTQTHSVLARRRHCDTPLATPFSI